MHQAVAGAWVRSLDLNLDPVSGSVAAGQHRHHSTHSSHRLSVMHHLRCTCWCTHWIMLASISDLRAPWQIHVSIKLKLWSERRSHFTFLGQQSFKYFQIFPLRGFASDPRSHPRTAMSQQCYNFLISASILQWPDCDSLSCFRLWGDHWPLAPGLTRGLVTRAIRCERDISWGPRGPGSRLTHWQQTKAADQHWLCVHDVSDSWRAKVPVRDVRTRLQSQMHVTETRASPAPGQICASSLQVLWTSLQKNWPLESAHEKDPQHHFAVQSSEQP